MRSSENRLVCAAIVAVASALLGMTCCLMPTFAQSSASVSVPLPKSLFATSGRAKSTAAETHGQSSSSASSFNTSSAERTGAGEQGGNEEGNGDEPAHEEVPCVPTIGIEGVGSGTLREDVYYVRDDLALTLSLTGRAIDEQASTVLDHTLQELLAAEPGEEPWHMEEAKGGVVTYTGCVTLGEGSYDVANLCTLITKDGQRATSTLALDGQPITTLVVDKTAPRVTSCSLDVEPARTVELDGQATVFFDGALAIAFACEDAGGISSVRLDGADDAGELHMDDATNSGTISIPDGVFSRKSTLVVVDHAGNSVRWSLGAWGAAYTIAGHEALPNAPLCSAQTGAQVGPEGHPDALVVDGVAPQIELEGVQEGTVTREAQVLHVRLHDRYLGYLALAEPARSVATITKDGAAIATINLAYDEAELTDTEHTYTVKVDARATHEDDGDYVLVAQVADLVGNTSESVRRGFCIDTTSPTLEVSFGDEKDDNEDGLYAHERAAQVRVCDKNLSAEQLNAPQAPISVEVVACDGGTEDDVTVSAWSKTAENACGCTVTFPANGTYELRVSGQDRAHNVLVGTEETAVSADGAYASGRFVIDTEPPSICLTYGEATPDPATFDGVDYFRVPITVNVRLADRNPELDKTYVTDADGKRIELAWSEEARDEQGIIVCTASFVQVEGASVAHAGRKELAAQASDRMGNAASAAMAPFVVDQTAPSIERAWVSEQPSAVGRLAGEQDSTLFFGAQDAHVPHLMVACSDAYLIDGMWTSDPTGVYVEQVPTVRGRAQATFDVPLRDRAGDAQDRDTAFGRDVVLMVRDLAGNVCSWDMGEDNVPLDGEASHPHELVYDATAPRVELQGADPGSYTQQPVCVVVGVHERNISYLQRFDPNRVVATIRHVSGDAGAAQDTQELAASALEGKDGDCEARQELTNDGHYTVEAQLTDYAGNASETVRLDTFTIDATPPRIAVSWDDVPAHNEMYYNQPRSATVQVHEHNFDASLVSVATTGEVGAWTDDGDTHTCSVYFGRASSLAAPHTLQVRARDKAGNEAEPVTETPFVLDMTAPRVSFAKRTSTNDPFVADSTPSELVDESAFAKALEPSVLFEDDECLDISGVEVSLVGKRSGTKAAATLSEHAQQHDSTSYEVSWSNLGLEAAGSTSYDVAADDVYELRARVADKAGNVSDERCVTFSVNRYGSNFFVESVGELAPDDGGVWPDALITAAPRIVVREVNVSGAASELDDGSSSAHTVTKEHARATREIRRVEAEGQRGYVLESTTAQNERNPYEGWSSYVYRIDAANFGEGSDSDFGDGGQGHYSVNVRSQDKAHNSNTTTSYWESDPARTQATSDKDATVSFTLDEKGPAIEELVLPTGFSVGTSFAASFLVRDEITNGDYVSVLVDGEPARVWWTETGEELGEDGAIARGGMLSFEVPARPLLAPRNVEVRVGDYTGAEDRVAVASSGGFVHTTLMAESVALLAAGLVSVVVIKVARALHPAVPTRRKDRQHGRSN